MMTPENLRFIAGRPVPLEETRHHEFKETKGANPVNSIKNTCDEYVVAFLNSEGGRIFWGIGDADRCVVGVSLTANARDDLRRVVTDKLLQIRPPIAPTAYRIALHPVYANDISTEPLADMFVVEIVAPRSDSIVLYATGGQDVYVRTDAGKKKLSPEEIQDEARRREAARRPAAKDSNDRVPGRYPGRLPAALPPKLKSDRKDILRDPDLSARLLRSEPPSLAEGCNSASAP
jgi:predicted HTH transcriptional regulator